MAYDPRRVTRKSSKRWACKHFSALPCALLNQSTFRNLSELSQITPETALYYCFHSSDPIPRYVEPSAPPPTATTLGVSAALDELRSKGCTLATKEWVENHWAMVLWKLAGMACLDPQSEADPRTKRWCWSEVMRQLRYR